MRTAALDLLSVVVVLLVVVSAILRLGASRLSLLLRASSNAWLRFKRDLALRCVCLVLPKLLRNRCKCRRLRRTSRLIWVTLLLIEQKCFRIRPKCLDRLRRLLCRCLTVVLVPCRLVINVLKATLRPLTIVLCRLIRLPSVR